MYYGCHLMVEEKYIRTSQEHLIACVNSSKAVQAVAFQQAIRSPTKKEIQLNAVNVATLIHTSASFYWKNIVYPFTA